MKKAKKKSKGEIAEYIKGSWKNFISSFRTLDRRILHVVVYDLVFFIICFGLFYLFRKVLVSKLGSIAGFNIGAEGFQPGPELAANAEIAKSMYSVFVAYIIIFLLIGIALYILANLLIWAQIAEKRLKKMKKKFAGKFFLMNFIWIAAWIALFFLVMNSIRTEKAMHWILGFGIAYAHLTTVMYISYFKSAKAKKAVSQAFSTGIGKIHYFIVPYAFAIALFYIVNYIAGLLQPLPDSYQMFAATVLVLFYFAWLRIYIYSFARDLA